MKKLIYLSIFSFLFAHSAMAQTAENPWSISAGANVVSIQDDAVDAGASFGIPALSLSRYIIGGFSLGVQYANNTLNDAASNGNDLDYYSLDGIVKYNIGSGESVLPIYLLVTGLVISAKEKVIMKACCPPRRCRELYLVV